MENNEDKIDLGPIYKRLNDIERVKPLLDKVLSKHNLIFPELSENDIDVEVARICANSVQITRKLTATQSLNYNFTKLGAIIADMLLISNFHYIENNIKKLEVDYKDVGFYELCFNDVIKYLNLIKKECNDVTETEVLTLATASAKLAIRNKIDKLNSAEYFGNCDNLLSAIRLSKFVYDPFKTVKKFLLRDKAFKKVYQEYKHSYRLCLETEKLRGKYEEENK